MGQPPQPAEYSLPGVMRYLQTEWQRNERDRLQWELERAEMKARIARLEGEQRSLHMELTEARKKVKILERSLQKRDGVTPSLLNGAREDLQDALDSATTENDGDPGLDLTPVIEARQFLEKCVQEVEYLLQSTNIEVPDQQVIKDVNDDKPDAAVASMEPSVPPQRSGVPVNGPVQWSQEHQRAAIANAPRTTKPPVATVADAAAPKTPLLSGQHAAVISPIAATTSTDDGLPPHDMLNVKRFGDWTLTHTFVDQRDSVRAFRFLSNDSLICGSDDGTLHWYYGLKDDAGAQQLFKGHQGVITSIVQSHANNVVYSAGQDKTVRCWSLSGRGSQRTNNHKTTNVFLRGHTDFVWGLDLHDESGILASCSADCTVRLWDMSTHEQVLSLTIDNPACAKAVRFVRGGNQILVGYEDNRVVLFDTDSGAPILRFATEQPSSTSTNSPYLHALAYSPSDSVVLSAHLEGVIRQFDIRSGELSKTFAAHDGTVNCVNFAPNGEQFLTGGDEGATKLWSLSNVSQPLTVLDHHETVEGVLDVQWQSPSLIGSSGGDSVVKLYRK